MYLCISIYARSSSEAITNAVVSGTLFNHYFCDHNMNIYCYYYYYYCNTLEQQSASLCGLPQRERHSR